MKGIKTMTTIKIGNRYEIYNELLETFDTLPVKVYNVRFAKMTGFYLESHADLQISEKIYGVHNSKIAKVLSSFKSFNRNLGVILSGQKGIGKSLFAKQLSIKAIDSGLPVIIVDRFIPGIASYLESIEQEVLVLFDEFDKTFGNVETGENEANPQDGLLSLFDGIAQGKKLFVITCNDIYRLNDYLINRPGRFHYHFRFSYPSADEIREYLTDKLPDTKYQSEIEKVVMFSKKVDLNYDCLRAIAFELSQGGTFSNAILDLNIVNTGNTDYILTLYFNNGQTLSTEYMNLNLFNNSEVSYPVYDSEDFRIGSIMFKPADCETSESPDSLTIKAESIKLIYRGNGYEDRVEKFKSLQPVYATIKRRKFDDIHYQV